MTDRLAQLRGGGGDTARVDMYTPREADDGGGGGRAAPAAKAAPPVEDIVIDTEAALENCFRIVATVQAGNREIQAKTGELRLRAAEYMKCFNPDETADTEAIQGIMDSVTQTSKRVKVQLDSLQAETKKMSATPERAQENAATVKIHENQHQHLTRSFLQAMSEYKMVVSENEKMLKQQTARRIKLKYTNADGTTISDAQATEMAEQVLEMGVQDAVLQQAQDTLAQILETRDDLIKMERSMRELHQLFNDLAILVNEQTELMDQIYANVQHSVEYVEKGREELGKAKKYAKKSRKKMLWVIVFIAIIFFFVLASVLGATI